MNTSTKRKRVDLGVKCPLACVSCWYRHRWWCCPTRYYPAFVLGHQYQGIGHKDVRHKNVLLARSFCRASFCLLLERQEGREQKSSARTMEERHPKPTFENPDLHLDSFCETRIPLAPTHHKTCTAEVVRPMTVMGAAPTTLERSQQ